MRAIARAHQNRNLADFEKALRDYREGSHRLFLSLIFPPTAIPTCDFVIGPFG